MDVSDYTWRKANKSGNNGGACVEIAFTTDGRAAGLVRDSKSPERGFLTTSALAAFITDVKGGRYKLPA